MKRRLILLLCVLALAGCRGEEVYPDRPIVLICPWSAGGGTDRVSRQVAVLLEQELGVPVNVVNATGGAGVTGHTRGALAPPDGYTMTMITVELNMLHWRGLTNITYRDFQPLMLLNRDDAALFVRDDAPWKSLKELQEAIRDQPRTLKASGTAQGGIWHVSLAGWLDAEGIPADSVVWISINGAGPSLQELMSGGVDMVCCSLPEAQTLMESGRIRPLGVMADQRVEAFPDVPTFREQGIPWSMGGWRGLAVPRGVPPERVDRLVAAIRKVIQSDDYLQFMRSTGFNAESEPPRAFAETLARLDETFGAILTSDAFQSVRRARYGPLLFPKVLAGLLVVVVAVLLVKGSLRASADRERASEGGPVRVLMAVAWVVAFVLLLDGLGYVLTAALLLMLLLLALRVRWPLAVGLPLILVPLTYQVFGVYLRVPLPWGWLGW